MNENGITINGTWEIPALGKAGYIKNEMNMVLSVVGKIGDDASKGGAQVIEMKKYGPSRSWEEDRQMWTKSKNMAGSEYFALTNVLSETLLHANSKGIMSIEQKIPVLTNRTKDLEVPYGMKENKGISSIIKMQFISLK